MRPATGTTVCPDIGKMRSPKMTARLTVVASPIDISESRAIDGIALCSLAGQPMRRVLFLAQLLLAAFIVRNWAYVTTYRLYLDRRIDAPRESAAVSSRPGWRGTR